MTYTLSESMSHVCKCALGLVYVVLFCPNFLEHTLLGTFINAAKRTLDSVAHFKTARLSLRIIV